MSVRVARTTTWLTAVLLSATLGCAHAPERPTPPSAEVRAHLGTIGVTFGGPAPSLSYARPSIDRRGGSVKGALKGAKVVEDIGKAGPAGFIAAVLTFPLILGFGAGVGAVMVPSEAAVNEAAEALDQAAAELRVSEAIRDHIVRTGRARTPLAFVPLPAADAVLSTADPVAAALSHPPVGVETILEVSARWLTLTCDATEINPSYTLGATLRVRLIRTADSAVAYDYDETYRGPTRTFVEWGANRGEKFRADVERAFQTLAEQIVTQLFFAEPPPHGAASP